jgi:hypothetical protein
LIPRGIATNGATMMNPQPGLLAAAALEPPLVLGVAVRLLCDGMAEGDPASLKLGAALDEKIGLGDVVIGAVVTGAGALTDDV